MSESTKHDAIYLQVCDDEDSEWLGHVTWCQERVHESDVKYIRADLVDALRQQLAAALAAIKMKDEAIEYMHKEKCDYMTLNNLGNPINETSYRLASEALAIQPDDSALKAWLGEPQPCRSDGRCQYAIDHGAEGLGHCPAEKCCMPLYSPKELK